MTWLSGASALVVVAIALLISPEPVAAHGLSGVLFSPLPLVVYLAGAAVAVALSFAVAFAYRGHWTPRSSGDVRHVPTAIILTLRAIGLVAWAWVVAQFIIGGSSDAEVGTLFTWIYGWVGLALVSALLGPVWGWIDPFSTIYDVGAWLLRAAHLTRPRPASYPKALSAWPAVAGFLVFVWLELAYGGADMAVVVVGYTLITLAAMVLFGKDAWRQHGEVFSVWFGVLGRLALYGPAGPPETGLVRRQRFPDGLLGRPWDASLVALVAAATGAILYDGLSQSRSFLTIFRVPDVALSTLLLGAFLMGLAALALGVGRRVGMTAMGAGLLPISVGYLIAHYFTFLLGDGQRIMIAISDPFQLGWDLFGTVFYERNMGWLSPSMLWAVMFTAVVGGHIVGAWAGHLAAKGATGSGRGVRRAQLPLAVIMVALTALTLWSLGQDVIIEVPGGIAASTPGATR